MDRPLSDLATDHGRGEVQARFVEITNDSGPSMANAALRALQAVYAAKRRTMRALPPDGPTAGIILNNEGTRAHVGLTLAQLGEHAPTILSLEPKPRTFVLLGLLLGARPWEEMAPLKWTDVSIRRRSVRFEKPKGWRPDRPNGYSLPLTKEARRVLALARRYRVPGNPFVFADPSRKSGHIEKVDAPKGIVPGLWGHGMRHTFSTAALECGFSEAEFGHAVLNHSEKKSITAVYPHARVRDATRMKKAAEVLTTVHPKMAQALGLLR
jgi:integrase